jgi:hypothetical protein
MLTHTLITLAADAPATAPTGTGSPTAVGYGGIAAGGLFTVTAGGWPVAAAGAAWAVAAWRRAPAEAPARDDLVDEPEEEALEPAPDERRAAYLRLIAAVIADRNGVHLGELYETLRQFEHWAARTDPELRALIDQLGIPVRRTMRVGKTSGRSGIHRDDLTAVMGAHGIPYPDPDPNPSPHREEAGHSRVEPPVERCVEVPVESRSTPVTVITSSRDQEPAWP